MAITNKDIIMGERISHNIWDSELLTYAAWQNKGYQVMKGQKAKITTQLWKQVEVKDKKTGEKKTKMVMCKSALFTQDQVEKIK